ncbi:MAG: transposase [Nanoarchaeota archaeon]
MELKERFARKIKRLLRIAGLPRWLHRFGPKRYELWQHLRALLVREYSKLGFRRVKQLFDLLGHVCPSKSALQYMTKRVPLLLWQRLLACTAPAQANIVAVDGITFSRSCPSFHYLHRIDLQFPVRKPVKLSIVINTRTKKVLAARMRSNAAHDVKDFKHLLKRIKPKIVVADKGYDSEAVHEHCFYRGIKTMIPLRAKAREGFFRFKSAQKFRQRTYHRRSIVESTFSALKHKFGTSVKCRTARTQRAEIYCRLILKNIFYKLTRLRTQPNN